MANLDDLTQAEPPALPVARPETTSANDDAPVRSPLSPPDSSDHAADGVPVIGPLTPPGSLTLQTILFGPLSVSDGAGRAAEIEELSRRAAVYATRARGEGTRRAYRSAWRQFEAWCAGLGREPLAADPDIIAMYAARCADRGLAVSSIRLHLAAIRTAYLLAGIALDLRHPRVAMVMEGITRARGVRPRRQAAPAVPDVLRLMLAKRAADTPLGAREHAMLLLGFGAALRRSELVALTVGDVELVPERGLLLTIGRSKTDQHGAGQRVAIYANPRESSFCPETAFTRWMEHRLEAPDLDWAASPSVRAERPLFCAVTKTGRVTGDRLSDKAVARLVKQAAQDAGLDPERYSGHSLRAGLATAAADQGAGLVELMRQTRHKSTEVALGYLRPAELWRNNVTEKVFGGDRRKG